MHLSAIWIYPVKGLRGVALGSAMVEPWGLAGDRRWMIVDSNGRFVSQREAPSLALIAAHLDGAGLRLSAPGRPDLAVAPPQEGPPVEVTIWRDRVAAAPAGRQVDQWLTAAVGFPVRLVHMAEPGRARPVDPAYGAAEDRVSFADGFPLLVATSASLADLATRVAMPDLSMDRFRTNLVVEGALPWAEDGWRDISVGAAAFTAVKPCGRCVVITIDQATGARHPTDEPLRSLMTFRRNDRGQPIFGQNLIPRSGGEIRVGDPVVATAAP